MSKSLPTENGTEKSGIRRFFSENIYIMAAFFTSAAVMLFVYFCFSVIPFGGSTVLRMDLYHQYGPLFAELYERIMGAKSFLYSWNSGLGGSFLGNFYNYLSSPLSIIILLFGRQNITEAIAALILLKAAFASAFFAYYLKRSQGKNDYSIAAFGMLYSFCGFFIAYYWNIMWLDAMALFPLVMLGIDLIIKNKKPGLFIFALTLTFFSNYYMAYMVCLFSILFFLVTYFGSYSITSIYGDEKGLNPKDYSFFKRLRKSRLLGSGITFAFGGIISAGLSAFSLLPVYYILQSCSATANPMPKSFVSYYKIFDFLANHLASVEPTIRSSGTDVLPNVYCGIAALLLVPLFLFTRSITIKEKTAYVGLLGLLYFSFNINYANFVWHAFHFPNDLPYRFSFMYSFVLLVMAYKAFVRLKEFKGKETLAAGIAVLVTIIVIQKLGSKNVNDITIVTSIAFTVLYTLLFSMRSRDRFPSVAFSVLILCSFTAEACIANTSHYSMNVRKADFAKDLPDFMAVKNQLDESDPDFYRMELTSLRARMDPCWYDYNGVSTFSSMAYEKVSNLESRLGLASNFINSHTYNPQTPIYNAMHALKYIVDNNNSDMNRIFYEPVFSKDKYTVYRNLYYLPIAFCVDENVADWDTTVGNPFEVQGDFFTRATGEESPFTRMLIEDAEYDNVNEIYYGLETGEFYFSKINENDSATLTLIIRPEITESCYLYVKSSNVGRVTVSGDSFSVSQNDDRDAVIDIGIREAGEEMRVELPIEKGNSGNISVYAYSMDTAKFVTGYNKLREGQMDIVNYKDTHIAGTLNMAEGGMLYTSIPYDKGWTVRVNGERVKEENIVAVAEALLGIKGIAPGPAAVEFDFVPRGLYMGLYISGASALVLLLFAIVRAIFKKLDGQNEPPETAPNVPFNLPPIEPGNYSLSDFVTDPEYQDQYEEPQSGTFETWPRDFKDGPYAVPQSEKAASNSPFYTYENKRAPQNTAPGNGNKSRVIIEDELDIVVEKTDES